MNVPKVKEFLEAMKALGSIRIITNNGVAVRRRRRAAPATSTLTRGRGAQVLESVTSFEGMFYADVPNKCAAARRGVCRQRVV